MGRLSIITQNVGTTDTGDLNITMLNPTTDIIVLCRQEVDDRYHDTMLYKYNEMMEAMKYNHRSFKLNEKAKQNITTTIFSKNNTHINETGIITLQPKEGLKGTLVYGFQKKTKSYSKGAVWITFTIDHIKIAIINVHLPMDSKKNGVGINHRIEAFNSLLNNSDIQRIIKNTKCVFIVGDLNFRIDDDSRNQLNNYLNSYHFNKKTQDISPDDKKVYTCKFDTAAYSSRYSSTCRLQNIHEKPLNETCFDTGNGNIRKNPSRCDRILLYDYDKPININKIPHFKAEGRPTIRMIQYETIIMSRYYDHNGIYAVFDIGDDYINKIDTGIEKERTSRKKEKEEKNEEKEKEKEKEKNTGVSYSKTHKKHKIYKKKTRYTFRNR